MRSAALLGGGARRDLAAGVGEDALEAATEGEDHNDDQRGDAGDQEAVLDGGGAALVHLGEAAVEHDAQVVKHGGSSLQWIPRAGAAAPMKTIFVIAGGVGSRLPQVQPSGGWHSPFGLPEDAP